MITTRDMFPNFCSKLAAQIPYYWHEVNEVSCTLLFMDEGQSLYQKESSLWYTGFGRDLRHCGSKHNTQTT